MAHGTHKLTVEEQIRALLDAQAASIRSRDVEGAAAHYSHDVVLFDLIDPLHYVGHGSLRKRLEHWFASFRGMLDFKQLEIEVTASDTVAFCHCINQLSAEKTDGKHLDMRWRSTMGLRKVEGQWTVTHAHSSVPFDPDSEMASLNLKA